MRKIQLKFVLVQIIYLYSNTAGDDGSNSSSAEGGGQAQLIQETDASAKLHCSGRAGVLALLVHMQLVRRQDLLSLVAHLALRPKRDHFVRLSVIQ